MGKMAKIREYHNICIHCEQPFIAQSAVTKWCNDPECQAAKREYRRLAQIEYNRKRREAKPKLRGKKTYEHICRSCGRVFYNLCPAGVWCPAPVCQEAKRNYRKPAIEIDFVNHQDMTDSLWSYHHIDLCAKCCKNSKLNRFGLCYECYARINNIGYGPLDYGSGISVCGL